MKAFVLEFEPRGQKFLAIPMIPDSDRDVTVVLRGRTEQEAREDADRRDILLVD